jgi:hypothetical protein
MTFKAETGIAGTHSTPVIYNLNKCSAGLLYNQLDFIGTGIDGVVEKFFGYRSRPLYYFACRNFVGKLRGHGVYDRLPLIFGLIQLLNFEELNFSCLKDIYQKYDRSQSNGIYQNSNILTFLSLSAAQTSGFNLNALLSFFLLFRIIIPKRHIKFFGLRSAPHHRSDHN